MYECETWATTKYLLSRLDAFNTWALRKILRVPYTRHVSNAEVRRTTGCSPLTHLVTNRRLRLFGHIARSSPREDHHRALAACIRQVLPDWKQPAGRPSHTWLRAIEADLGPLNFGLTTAWRKATTRDEWRHIVDTATLQWSTLWKKKSKMCRHATFGSSLKWYTYTYRWTNNSTSSQQTKLFSNRYWETSYCPNIYFSIKLSALTCQILRMLCVY